MLRTTFDKIFAALKSDPTVSADQCGKIWDILGPANAAVGDFLNDEQAADLLGVDARTVRLWRSTRGLPHMRLTHKVVRILRSDLDHWAAKQRVAFVEGTPVPRWRLQ